MKIRNFSLVGTALLAASLLTGCIGYNSTFFATKTNVGLDVDSKTPTMEVSVARREVVVEPSFENGQTPPVAASFRTRSGAWIFADIDTTFSGGDAAYIMSKLYSSDSNGAPDNYYSDHTGFDSKITLSNAPSWKVLGIRGSLPTNSTVRPLIFGTDTSLGVKVAWSGLTAQFPDSVKVGFNRKEIALAPVNGRPTAQGYEVKMPSFLATHDTGVSIGSPQGGSNTIKFQQYFATGEAANYLAFQPAVRESMAERLDPVANSKKKITADRKASASLVTDCQKLIDQLTTTAQLTNAVTAFSDKQLISSATAKDLTAKAATDPTAVKTTLKDTCENAGYTADGGKSILTDLKQKLSSL